MAARFVPYAANPSDVMTNSPSEDDSVGNEKLTRKAQREKVRREKRQYYIYKMKEVLQESEQISAGSKLDILNVLELTLKHMRDLEAEVHKLKYEKASRVAAMRGKHRAIGLKGSKVEKKSSGCTSAVPNTIHTATLSTTEPNMKPSGVASQSPSSNSMFPLMGANALVNPGKITPQICMNYMNFMMQCSMANLQTFGGLNLQAMTSAVPSDSTSPSKGQSSIAPLHSPTPQGSPLQFS